jgi:60 kDa SS-A/Ro ribonucleoprotein
MQVNTKPVTIMTHEGGVASRINAEQALRRSVMACMLWEDQFYEQGQSIADRIAALVPEVNPLTVGQMAIEARSEMNLRHAPLLLAREMARHEEHRAYVADTLYHVIQRADELAEFLALYWKGGKVPLAKQVKLGLAAAFTKFDEYALQKYNRDNAIKLRDVLFMVHPKPKDAAQELVFKKLANDELATPDTWEVALSAADGVEKKEKWERLLRENKLGALALLRNLRNMTDAKVDAALIRQALFTADVRRVLPFRFIAAARYAPQWEPELESLMLKSITGKLPGKTVLLIDVSGSMDAALSGKSDMTRIDAACGVAMVAREMCEEVAVFSFSSELRQVPPRRGFALRDAIVGSQNHRSTYLGNAISYINQDVDYARLIVVTDEQTADSVPAPKGKGYMINVASYQNGVGYGNYTKIDGWSEAVIKYIVASEEFTSST